MSDKFYFLRRVMYILLVIIGFIILTIGVTYSNIALSSVGIIISSIFTFMFITARSNTRCKNIDWSKE